MALAETFVQVEAGLPSSKLVDALRSRLGVSKAAAIGHLVQLWIATLALGKHGQIGDRSDLWIEDAAGWQGEGGAFANVIRAMHLDDAGAVREWAAKYGRIETIREGWRTRKAADRASHGHPRDDGETSSRTKRGPLSTSSSLAVTPDKEKATAGKSVRKARGQARAAEPASLVTEDRAAIDVDAWVRARQFPEATHATIAGFLRGCRAPAAVRSVLDLHLTGELMHRLATPAQLAVAVMQYAANSANDGKFHALLFDRYVRTATTALPAQAAGRVALAHESRAIAEAQERKDALEREVRADVDAIERFRRADPARFQALEVAAERHVPTTITHSRAAIVRGYLAKLVLAELASGGAPHAE